MGTRRKAIGRSDQWQYIEQSNVGEKPLRAGDTRRSHGMSIAAYLDQAKAGNFSPVEVNHQINRDYISFGLELQRLIDRLFHYDDAVRATVPNWFPIAFHVSRTVGDSIAGALAGLDLLQDLDSRRGRSSVDAMHALGLPHNVPWVHRLAQVVLRWFGVPHDLGTVLFAALRMNYGSLWNPTTIITSCRRLRHLYALAPGTDDLEKSVTILRTTIHMLAAGNQAVYADIGPAIARFLDWQANADSATGDDVLSHFALAGADSDIGRSLFQLGLSHSGTGLEISPYNTIAPPSGGPTLLLAACALYQEANVAASTEAKASLICIANALLALREQRDLLQPAFDAEQQGKDVFQLLTPMLRVHFGRVIWNYTSFQLDPTRGNWGLFADRWPAIMAAFDTLYGTPQEAWDFPNLYRQDAMNIDVADPATALTG